MRSPRIINRGRRSASMVPIRRILKSWRKNRVSVRVHLHRLCCFYVPSAAQLRKEQVRDKISRWYRQPAVALNFRTEFVVPAFRSYRARNGESMISETLIEILRCPSCVRTTGGDLKLYKDTWFICKD